jgi:peptidase M23-like protein
VVVSGAQRLPRLLVAALALTPGIVPAQDAPALSLPAACEIGKACVVQNYVDADPGPAASDYRCGFLTYDGHKGTDIRVRDVAALQQGVKVVAAAPGRVRAVRDGMPDVSIKLTGRDAVKGKEAGNSVVIDHGGGWETQYSHMRSGSVVVHPGDEVKRGQMLGLVGLSGNTEFPHVHFEVRHQRRAIDPFVGTGEAGRCKAGTAPLWRSDALAALAYVETGVLDAGIAGAPPRLSASSMVSDGARSFDEASMAAVFWVQVFGAHEGDVEELRLLTPDGRVLSQKRDALPRNLAQWFSYTGKARTAPGWPPGVYRGEYALYRGSDERKVLDLVREVRIKGGSSGSD